jgi:hypothetical protein
MPSSSSTIADVVVAVGSPFSAERVIGPSGYGYFVVAFGRGQPRALQPRRERTREREVLVEDDAVGAVFAKVLDEGGARFAYHGGLQTRGVRSLDERFDVQE